MTLINQIVEWSNLLEAHRLARRGKRDRFEVARFEANLWEELGAIQLELLYGEYTPGRYRSFIVYEPKKREIFAAPYRDRVVQHAICLICGPIWDRSMIYDSYACRKDKGTHAGARRLRKWLKGMTHSGDVWVTKMDVEKYFASISHQLCKEVIRDKIHCKMTLHALDTIIDSTADVNDPDPIGIPVGNLTSQWIANLVGNRIDQWATRRMGYRRYIRYMDDMVVLSRSKEEALAIRDAFELKIQSMGMEFSKVSVLPYQRGINFLGYRIWPDKVLLRKDSIRRMKRNLKDMENQYKHGEVPLCHIQARINSWIGHTIHADSYNIRKKVLSRAIFSPSLEI